MNEKQMPTTTKHQRIAVCGVRFSPNLGDGVISDCLGWMIRHVAPRSQCVFVDLAGRTAFGEETISARRDKLRLLLSLPVSVQNMIVRAVLGRKIARSLRPQWSRDLRDCAAVLIGGGQLLSDADLNFPLKIQGLMNVIREHNLPAAIYACGVTCNQNVGATLLSRCLNDPHVKAVYLRDKRSLDSLSSFPNLGGTAKQAGHAFDPAVHVAQAYADRLSGKKRFDLGVSFADPVNMVYSSGQKLPYAADLADIIVEVVTSLAKSGKRVALFTNGALEDEQFLNKIDQRYQLTSQVGVTRIIRPIEPVQLVKSIDQMESVIAHRLHTNIIAYGLQIPSLGLEWSPKVPDFFRLVKREHFLIAKDELTTKRILQRYDEMANSSVDVGPLRRVQDSSFDALRNALKATGISTEEAC